MLSSVLQNGNLLFWGVLICFVLRVRKLFLKKLMNNGYVISWWQEVLLLLFWSYVTTVFILTIMSSNSPAAIGEQRYNFIPFKTIGSYMWVYKYPIFSEYVVRNFWANIFLLFPISLLLTVLRMPKSFWIFLFFGISVTVSIELMQFILTVANINWRSTDVDDCFLNIIGWLLGYVVGIVVRKISFKNSRKSQA